MATQIDFSQYERKSPIQQNQPMMAPTSRQQEESLGNQLPNQFGGAQNKQIDFSQYERKPERTGLEKGARIATQFGLGLAENALLPYEIGVAPLASEKAQQVPYRENLFSDIERLQEQKQMGQWDKQDQDLYDSLVEQVKNPEKAKQFVKTADIGVRGLTEKATGLDLHPEGIAEKAAGWMGFMKDPRKGVNLVKDLYKSGINPKEVLKIVAPGTKTLSSLGAATGLQMAEDGQFGPLGTITAATVGHLAGMVPKGLIYAAKNPAKVAAGAVNLFTGNNSKKSWTEQILKDAKASGIQLDAGTISNSDFIKMLQSHAIQSGLSGSALKDFQKELSQQIIREYEKIGDSLGQLRFENSYQAGEALKDAVKTEKTFLQDYLPREKQEGRSLVGRVSTEELPAFDQEFLHRISPTEFVTDYQAGSTLGEVAKDVKQPIKESLDNRWNRFNRQIEQLPVSPQARLSHDLETFVQNHRGSLILGESTPEARVVQTAENLLNRLRTPEGGLIGVALEDLIKTKRTLGDIANYEFGGSDFSSAYKQLVAEVDSAIKSTIERQAPRLSPIFEELNADYTLFKDTFENRNVMPLFEPKNNNYNAIYNKFKSNPDALRSLEDMLILSPRGDEVLNQVKRDYAQNILRNENLSEREIRNLIEVLGPESEQAVNDLVAGRQFARENPIPRPTQSRDSGVRPSSQPTTGKNLKGRMEETALNKRKRYYEKIKNTSPEKLFKEMDSVSGIKNIREILSSTEEGKKLFEELSRFKLSEMIDKKMTHNQTEQLKLGTFSGLMKTSQDQAIIKELLGNEAFSKLRLLQKNAGNLAESAGKFFNASKSGITAGDLSKLTAVIYGVITGNPWMVVPSLAYIGGMRGVSKLLSNPKFLGYLEEAVMAPAGSKKLTIALEKLTPFINEAKNESTKD